MVLVAVSSVAATFGIQNADALPGGDVRLLPGAHVGERLRRFARAQIEIAHDARCAEICFSEWSRKKAAAPIATQAIAPNVSLAARDRIEVVEGLSEATPEYHIRTRRVSPRFQLGVFRTQDHVGGKADRVEPLHHRFRGRLVGFSAWNLIFT